jgi:NADH dehydrogenase/NADH:ubiquinone oxidoreductase subunit G
MPHYVEFTIDGAPARAVKGQSVLEAAMEYGICIPHLCHSGHCRPVRGQTSPLSIQE